VRFFLRFVCAVAAICWLLDQSVWAVDRVEEFNKAKRSLVQQLHNKQPSVRVEALGRLQEFPIADAVKLIQGGLVDEEDEVHEAALATLLKMSGNQEVCDTLLGSVRKSINRKNDAQNAAPLLAVLLSSSLPSVQRETNEFFDKLGGTRNGVTLAVTLADELGHHHKAADVLPLVRLSKTKIFADHFGIRRAVVQSLTRIRTNEAIGALVELMPKVGGEAQADAVEYLSQITGQIFGMESAAWDRWWGDVKDSYTFPTRVAPAPYRSVGLNTAGYYYGLPLFAERLVFVLDTSGSMLGQRLAAAKRELVRAIAGLPSHTHFSIVIFNGTVTTWQKQLVPASADWKDAATNYVNVQEAHSHTASYDALETAFQFDTEAIYFLSDGEPRGGKIVAPVDIVAAITEINKTRRISLYTIGIGAGIPGGPLDSFLKTLAEQNLGLYRRVDG
jgi:hypothetical protein